jgi:transcriptional regulator with XRE-family HTH domain
MLNIANTRKEWFIEQIEGLKEKGTSYAEIAASLGVKPQYLNLIKNTERGASEKLTLKLCEAFNINHNDLLKRIGTYEKQITEIPEINEPSSTEISSQGRIPLHDNAPAASRKGKKRGFSAKESLNREDEWIDAGGLFPEATSAVRHYGDSMPEYPSGSILVLKRLTDFNLIIWGRNYHVETKEIAVTKRLQSGGENHIIGYSSNLKTYPDGRLIHEPVKILKKDIRHIHIILGCIIKEFGEGIMPTAATETI